MGGSLSSVTLPGPGSCLFPAHSESDPGHAPAPALFSCLARAESPGPLVVTSCVTPGGQRSERPGAGLSLSRLVFQSRSTSFVGHSLFPQTEAEAASTALLVAAFNGKEDRVKELLSREDTNPNVSYSNGNTPLIIAVQENHTRIVQMLLCRPDIKVNMRGLDGYTALIRACFERSDIVTILLKRPDVDVNLATYYGTTALTYAIRNGNMSAVRELIAHPKINVNFQSRHGENGLFEAVSYKRMDIVEMLLSHTSCQVDILDQHDRTPFLVACQYGYEDIACALIEAGCDTTVEDDCSRNGLYHAVKRKREQIIHALLDRREPFSLRHQCRTVIRSYLRSVWGPGVSIREVISNIPRHEVPATLVSFLTFESR